MTDAVLGSTAPYVFEGGYPTDETVRRAFAEADLIRAVSMYRFFFPTVSLEATWRGNLTGGVVPNTVFPLLNGTPQQFVFTPNSDTPYAGLAIDLSDGPMVVELPPGPLMGTANDLNQLWLLDIGLPGPAGPAGGKHLLLPPGYDGDIPDGYYSAVSSTNRVLVLVRALPKGKDMDGAVEFIKSVRAYPLHAKAGWQAPTWVDLTQQVGLDFSPVRWEDSLDYWTVLNEIIQAEPAKQDYRYQYGELAVLGIEKGRPFEPDDRMKTILTRAAKMGHAQLAAQSFADRRPDRVVWPDRKWEWAVLQPTNGRFDTENYTDLYAREKWFYQAQIESPAMFARQPGAGSLYWLGLRDSTGAYLDGGRAYRLRVPQPVPHKLFWSVTVYDARTRSEVLTEQNLAALRSMFELADAAVDADTELLFGPEPPTDEQAESRWVKTIPGQGWFVYFRIYGPEESAFGGTWQLPDFEALD